MKTLYSLFSCLIIFSLQSFSQTQPLQPANGPGGSDYAHSAVTFYNYASQPDGFFIFEPSSPAPDSANVVVFIHGLNIVNPYLYGAWINHLVKHGNIVIYPKYQDAAGTTPTTQFNANVITAIINALDALQLPGHVKPRIENFAVAGHSYGGLMAPNMGILAATSGFPVPKAIMSCQGYTDNTTETRLPDYSIMPADINLLIVVGDNDVIVGTTFGHFLMDSTVNVPTSHKNLITHHSDNHGSPAIGSTHFEPCSRADEYDTGETNLFTNVCALGEKIDAVDYYCYWKLLDALLDCAFYGQNCNYAFGDTPEQHGMGEWSDAQPVVLLTVEPAAGTGIEQFGINDGINIYPNPAGSSLTVAVSSSSSSSSSKTVVKIFNAQGQVVHQSTINSQQSSIDVSGLSSGIYFLSLWDAVPAGRQGEQTLIRKLVVQH